MLSTPNEMSDDCSTACDATFDKIVAIQRNVQRAHRHIHAVDAAHGLRDPLRQRHAAPPDPDHRQVLGPAALLHDFVRQPLQSAVNLRRRHQLCLLDDAHVGRNPSTSRRNSRETTVTTA